MDDYQWPDAIDNEPEFIHPYCQAKCGMAAKDPDSQCGDGCILLTVYGQASGIPNKRYYIPRLCEAIFEPHPLMAPRKKARWWKRGKRRG